MQYTPQATQESAVSIHTQKYHIINLIIIYSYYIYSYYIAYLNVCQQKIIKFDIFM